MLNGLDPIIIFQYRKKVDTDFIGPQNSTIGRIPFIAQYTDFVEMPPVPIYLSEQLTGLFIDTESKHVEIGTNTETLYTGEKAEVVQKGVSSTVNVQLTALRDSIGLTLLSAMIDLLFDKVTSKEYSITYMHGPTTIFKGLLSSYAVTTVEGTNKITINFEITRGEKEPDAKVAKTPVVGAQAFTAL